MTEQESGVSEQPQGEVDTKIAHGHSRLIWLLDDIEAHLDGLKADSDDRGLILEELVSFARSFSEELDGHISEEERDLFPAAEAVARADERDELAQIYDEHRRLEAEVDEFWAVLSQICEQAHARHELCLESLSEQVLAMREQLCAHSLHERTFLSRMELRVEDCGTRFEG